MIKKTLASPDQSLPNDWWFTDIKMKLFKVVDTGFWIKVVFGPREKWHEHIEEEWFYFLIRSEFIPGFGT